jgi:hypothetical protein
MANNYSWRVRTKRNTRVNWSALAGLLGFRVNNPGHWNGQPSAPQLLDAIAAAIKDDPAAVAAAFVALGIIGPDYDPAAVTAANKNPEHGD